LSGEWSVIWDSGEGSEEEGEREEAEHRNSHRSAQTIRQPRRFGK
jgi:hypothetical protein